MKPNNRIQWAVAVFAARESVGTLAECLSAVLASCSGKASSIDVLVNGNHALAEEFMKFTSAMEPTEEGPTIRVWFIPFGDKAHAWNEYVYKIWQPSDVAYFIDGYANIRRDALELIDAGLRQAPFSLAASGVPTIGRSASALRTAMLTEGGIHGNLYALKGETMSMVKETGFRLPLGLYRTDPVLGAAINYGFDPVANTWNTNRILVHPGATWYVHPGVWWRPKDLLAQFRRILRQAQGHLENRAVHEHMTIDRRAPRFLPSDVSELVSRWIKGHPRKAMKMFVRHPLTSIAAWKLRKPRDWSGASKTPSLLIEKRFSSHIGTH